MALGLFRHWSLTDLQTLKSDAITAMLDGKNRVVSAAGAGDVNVTKEWNIESKVFWEELNYALELLAPGTYTPKVTRTAIAYA